MSFSLLFVFLLVLIWLLLFIIILDGTAFPVRGRDFIVGGIGGVTDWEYVSYSCWLLLFYYCCGC